MLSKETLERYRRMTCGERLSFVLDMIDENVPYLFYGQPEVVNRRFEHLERENRLRNENILKRLASVESADE